MAAKEKTLKAREAPQGDPRFVRVVEALVADRQVTRGDGKGFGSGTLKVKGRIFALMSSKGEFVVKLPKHRVDDLVSAGQGERFNPGHGRLMKEWIVVGAGSADWVNLAREARNFVKHDE